MSHIFDIRMLHRGHQHVSSFVCSIAFSLHLPSRKRDIVTSFFLFTSLYLILVVTNGSMLLKCFPVTFALYNSCHSSNMYSLILDLISIKSNNTLSFLVFVFSPFCFYTYPFVHVLPIRCDLVSKQALLNSLGSSQWFAVTLESYLCVCGHVFLQLNL